MKMRSIPSLLASSEKTLTIKCPLDWYRNTEHHEKEEAVDDFDGSIFCR